MSAPLRLAVLYPDDLSGENAGLYGLHVRSLIELLEPIGWIVEPRSVLDPDFATAALEADVVVMQMLVDPEAEGVILRRRELGRPTVYEITDNVLGVGEWLPHQHGARSPLMRQNVAYHAYLSDALQMLVPALVDLFAPINPRTILLQPRTPFPAEVPPKPPGFVFGWGGSRSHSESLAAAAPAVVEFCRRRPEATFSFMGDARLFEEHFSAIPPHQRDVHPFGEWEEWLEFAGGLHVGIAPMIATPFNATRSDTRVGVYAGHGVAAVLEDAPAHKGHGEHAQIYRTADELLAILEELFDDRDQVAALSGAGREWMLRERSPAALAAERDSAYRELLAHTRGAHERASAERVPESDPDLRDRLRRAQLQHPAAAVVTYREIVEEQPGYDQAHLRCLRCLEKLGRYDEVLDYASSIDPSPVYSDLFAELKARAASHVRPHERQRHVATIHSAYRRARLTEFESPAEQSRAVLEHNPYDYFALAGTIARIEREDADLPELGPLHERACMVAPDLVPAPRRPERLVPFLPA